MISIKISFLANFCIFTCCVVSGAKKKMKLGDPTFAEPNDKESTNLLS
jgi:hypothetical protein